MLCASPSHRRTRSLTGPSGPQGEEACPSSSLSARVLGGCDAAVGSTGGTLDDLDVPKSSLAWETREGPPHSLHGWGLLASLDSFSGPAV